MFSFSVLFVTKLLKALATFLDPLIFHYSKVSLGNCSTEGKLPVSFFIMFQVAFLLLLDLTISVLLCCFLASFKGFLRNLKY